MDIKSFIAPFNSLNKYLHALRIIKANFSAKLKNYDNITLLINNHVKDSHSITSITKFVDNVLIWLPVTYKLTPN